MESANASARAGAEASLCAEGSALSCAETLARFPANHKLLVDGFRVLQMCLERGRDHPLCSAALRACSDGNVRETALALMKRCWDPGVEFHPGSAPAAASAVVRTLKRIERGEEPPQPQPEPANAERNEEEAKQMAAESLDELQEWATADQPHRAPKHKGPGPPVVMASARLSRGRSRGGLTRVSWSDSGPGFLVVAGAEEGASAAPAADNEAAQAAAEASATARPSGEHRRSRSSSECLPAAGASGSANDTCGSQAGTAAPLLQELMRDELLSLHRPQLLPTATSGPGPLSEAEAAAAWRDHRPRRETAPQNPIRGFSIDLTRGPGGAGASAAAHAAATLPSHCLPHSGSSGLFDQGIGTPPLPRLDTPAQAAVLFDNLDLSNLSQLASAAALFETLELEQDDTAEAAAAVGNLPGGRRSPGSDADVAEPPPPGPEGAALIWGGAGGVSPRDACDGGEGGAPAAARQQQGQHALAPGTSAESAASGAHPRLVPPLNGAGGGAAAGPIAPPDPFGVAASWLGFPQVAPCDIRSHPSVTAIWEGPMPGGAPSGGSRPQEQQQRLGPAAPASLAALRKGGVSISVGGGLGVADTLLGLSVPLAAGRTVHAGGSGGGSDGVSVSRTADGVPLRKAATIADLIPGGGAGVNRSSIGSDSSSGVGPLLEHGPASLTAPWRPGAVVAFGGAPQWRGVVHLGAGSRGAAPGGRGGLVRSATTSCVHDDAEHNRLWCDPVEEAWPVAWAPREEEDGTAPAEGPGGHSFPRPTASGGAAAEAALWEQLPAAGQLSAGRRRSLPLEAARSMPAAGAAARAAGAACGGVWASAALAAKASAGQSDIVPGAGAEA